MRKKHVLRAFFASLPLMAAAALVFGFAGNSATKPSGFSSIRRADDVATRDYSTATEAEKLSVKIVSSSESSMGQFLEISFNTGGTCYQDVQQTYQIASSDSEFTDYLENTFNKLTEEDKAAIEAQYEAGEYSPRIFDGYVQSVVLKNKNAKQLVFPKCLYRNFYWGIRPTTILDQMLEDWSTKKVTEIYIPKTITHVSDKAFRGVDSSAITFYLEADAVPEEWEEGWNHDCQVVTGFDYNTEFKVEKGSSATSKSLPLMQVSTIQFGDETINYYLGYYTEESNYPLVAEYHLEGETASDPYHYFEFEKKSENANYDAVGSGIGDFTNNLFCDIPLNEGEKIDVESIRLQNILAAVNTKTELFSGDGATKEFTLADTPTAITEILVDNVAVENTEETTYYTLDGNKVTFAEAPAAGTENISITYRIPWMPVTDQLLYADPAVDYSHSYALEDFVSTEFTGLTTFGDFTMIRTSMKLADIETAYSMLKSSTYNSYKDQLAAGTVKVRARLTSISTSSLEFICEEGSEEKRIETRISSPVAQVKLSNPENGVSFLIKNSDLGENFNTKAIRQVNLLSLYVTIDLFAENGSIARSAATTRFGIVSVMPHQSSAPSSFNAGLFLVLEALIYVVLFAAGTVALFFYRSAKYKNDEFLRVKPKRFFLHALLALVCGYIVLLALTTIILRTGVFANAVVVYNPLDAFIIIFGILSILVIGYFAKYLVGAIKASRERSRIRRLKLNEDVPDDGTL